MSSQRTEFVIALVAMVLIDVVLATLLFLALQSRRSELAEVPKMSSRSHNRDVESAAIDNAETIHLKQVDLLKNEPYIRPRATPHHLYLDMAPVGETRADILAND